MHFFGTQVRSSKQPLLVIYVFIVAKPKCGIYTRGGHLLASAYDIPSFPSLELFCYSWFPKHEAVYEVTGVHISCKNWQSERAEHPLAGYMFLKHWLDEIALVFIQSSSLYLNIYCKQRRCGKLKQTKQDRFCQLKPIQLDRGIVYAQHFPRTPTGVTTFGLVNRGAHEVGSCWSLTAHRVVLKHSVCMQQTLFPPLCGALISKAYHTIIYWIICCCWVPLA